MSIKLKTLSVDKYQRFSDKVEFRFYNDELYLCKVEDNGQILYGANLVLDSLPAAAIYGENGSPQSFVLSSEVNLNVNLSSLDDTQKEELKTALEAAILAGVSIEGAMVIITGFVPVTDP